VCSHDARAISFSWSAVAFGGDVRDDSPAISKDDANEITPVGFLYFCHGRRRGITGRGSRGDHVYAAARPVQCALRQHPASCRVPRQVQVEPCDLHADWYFPRNWAVRSMART
jgi:hypothetical protein